METGEYFMTE